MIVGDSCSLKKAIEPAQGSDLLTSLVDVRYAGSIKSVVPHVVGEQLVERLNEVVEFPLRWPQDPTEVLRAFDQP